MPSLGSVLKKIHPPRKPVFPYLTLGTLRHLVNNASRGQNAGCLGKVYDPFSFPTGARDTSGVRSVMGSLDSFRLAGRRQMLDTINRTAPALEAMAATQTLD